MELEIRRVTIYTDDKNYDVILFERDDMREVYDLEYGKISINTTGMSIDDLRGRFRSLFMDLYDDEEVADYEAGVLLEFCITGRLTGNNKYEEQKD